MNTFYVLKPTEGDILHFGKGHDDNPPGRGSGRFAFGTGKRPHQHVAEPSKPKTKEEILRSGSAKEVLSIHTELTNQELADAVRRLESLNSLGRVSAAQNRSKWDKLNDYRKYADDIVAWSSTGIKAWNNFAAIYNSAAKDKEGFTPLPGISMPNMNSGGDKNKK